ncbi:Putative phosphatidylglycerol/phosphatidylinositol transfer protein DDB_G0278295 [Geodia barretti]|uniref:Phosphatidylglycerol/phosphatidylinositol transfer protein DDB_G0278295 n=1 Tax=Geodia barretti TaxID=519541 RepID=A0AA35WV37_GEOBA|nr:Putative phosphatidylglycerol/phosphatidylinositol transfer protein DDB_G0278295 [Geodia barretti]
MTKEAALLVLVAIGAAVALPMQWLELEHAKTLHKSSRLGEVYKFCNKSLDPLVITNLTLSPDPPREGPLTISVSYHLSEKVTGGVIKVDVKLDGIPVYSNTLDLCQTLVQAGVKCPIGPVSGRKSFDVTLPAIGGHITANAVVTDQNGKELACVDLDFKL